MKMFKQFSLLDNIVLTNTIPKLNLILLGLKYKAKKLFYDDPRKEKL